MPTFQDVQAQIKASSGGKFIQKRAEHELLTVMLGDEERIYNAAQASYANQTGVLYLTGERLIFLSKSAQNTTQHEFPLTSLQSVKHIPGRVFAELEVQSDGRTYTFKHVAAIDKGRSFSTHLQTAIDGRPLESLPAMMPTSGASTRNTLSPGQLKVFGVLAILAIGFWLIIARPWESNSSPPALQSNRPATVRSTAPADNFSTMVRDLSIIEGVSGNTSKMRQIERLLTSLDTKFPENQQQIGDMTANAYAILEKNGKPASIIAIMTEMEQLGGFDQTYADMVASWLLLQGVKP